MRGWPQPGFPFLSLTMFRSFGVSLHRIRERIDLRRAQHWGVETLKRPWSSDRDDRLPGVILAWSMGAGKSVTVATALRDLLDEFVIRKALIVSTVSVVESVWPDEFQDWCHLKAVRTTLVRVLDDDEEMERVRSRSYEDAKRAGDTAKQAKKISDSDALDFKYAKLARLADDDAEVHFINKEAFDWLWAYFNNGKTWPYDVLIFDDVREAKSGKKRKTGEANRKTQHKDDGLSRFGLFAKASKKCKVVFQLTGTPCANSLRNLWGLAYLVDGGERLGTARTAFERRWFTQDRYTYKFEPKLSAEREIAERLSDIMFSLGPEEYADMPPMVNLEHKVSLPSKVLRAYKDFEKELVSEEYDVEAVSKGVLHNKLLQFSNGSAYRDDGNDVWIHDRKLEQLIELREQIDEPLLVAYSFRFDIDRIRRRFKKALVFNQGNIRENKRRWNEGEVDMMLIHPASGGHGNNLQFGGNRLVWYGLTSDLELYLQLNKRLHRPGQTETVFNHHILAKGTIDEDIMPIYLDPKTATQDRVLDLVRVRLGHPSINGK